MVLPRVPYYERSFYRRLQWKEKIVKIDEYLSLIDMTTFQDYLDCLMKEDVTARDIQLVSAAIQDEDALWCQTFIDELGI